MNSVDPAPSDAPQLRTLLLTDLVNSTSLVERMGDVPAADLFREHDRLVLRLQQQWRGRLIDRSDGLLLLFERPVDGLGFALDYLRGLQEIGKQRGLELQARAGLHVGEVLTWKNSEAAVQVGAKPLEVEGLAKPMAGRLMSLARPGQILLSAVAETLTHRAARELGERGQNLLWKSHGRWRFKGVPEALEVFEVGEVGVAPLRAPANAAKAWRDIPLWRRPAMLAVELLLVAGLGLGAWFLTRPQPAIAFSERDWVVVGDLRNLTGERVLDDSLAQAFRISLEQSRYVNVLSDMKARDTLARMQRRPDTVLDRAVASEIAIRDGARAVILPTVSEVGGRVRVSAEVIDPFSQTTVYAESVDGTGAGSALGSIDQVTTQLRSRLGEAMGSIEKDSAPLPQVTTSNLDALRAYALGVKAYGQRNWPETLEFFGRALQLDPDFALAHLGMTRVFVANVDATSALEHLKVATKLRSRLAPREQLYLDAWIAEFAEQQGKSAASKWKLLADMYPDYYAGHYNYAWAAFTTNEFSEAMKYALHATAPQEPLNSAAYELIARVKLAQGQHEEALAGFEKAGAMGKYYPGRRRANALAAMGRFEEAQLAVGGTSKGGIASGDIIDYLELVALAVDQGRCDDAARVAQVAAGKAIAETPLLSAQFRLIQQGVLGLCTPKGINPEVYREIFDFAHANATQAAGYERGELAFVAAATVYLAQRLGHTKTSASMIQPLSELVAAISDRNAEKLLAIVSARQQRISGDVEGAISSLKKQVDGTELYQTHVELRDALRAGGQYAEALREDQWLWSHRGLAYIEAAGNQTLQALNVADSNLARLDAAELLGRMGKSADASAEAQRFQAAWKGELPDHLRRRLDLILPDSKQKTMVWEAAEVK